MTSIESRRFEHHQTLRDNFGGTMNDDLVQLAEIFDAHLRRMIVILPLQFVVLLVVALIS